MIKNMFVIELITRVFTCAPEYSKPHKACPEFHRWRGASLTTPCYAAPDFNAANLP